MIKKISVIGDIMSDHSQIEKSLKIGYDNVFSFVSSTFKDSDYLIANLETPISSDETSYSKEKYSFCAPQELAKSLKNMNDNLILLLANNHCLDRGILGLNETISILDKLDIIHTGTNINNQESFLSLTIGKTKIAIINYTYGTNAFVNHNYLTKQQKYKVNLLQNQELQNRFYRFLIHSNNIFVRCVRKVLSKCNMFQINLQPYERVSLGHSRRKKYYKMIKTAKKSNDLVFSFLHIGSQYSCEPTKYTKKMINKSIKKGCDLVSCNHEHVIHKIGFKNNSFYTCSLGNFLGTNGVISPPFNKGANYSIGINIYIDDYKKEISNITFSVFKLIESNGIVKVVPSYDFIKQKGDNITKVEVEQIVIKLLGYAESNKKEYVVK